MVNKYIEEIGMAQLGPVTNATPNHIAPGSYLGNDGDSYSITYIDILGKESQFHP